MKIPAINERDFDRRALQCLRGSQSAESATKNDESMLCVHARPLRELLPARVTNRGFPDFDLNVFLAPHEVGEKEIDQLFESALQLLDLSHPDEGLSVE